VWCTVDVKHLEDSKDAMAEREQIGKVSDKYAICCMFVCTRRREQKFASLLLRSEAT
jgi:hypothetical protein